MMGRVQVASVQHGSSSAVDTWINVCADEFDQVDADVVCRQMGFEVAEILVPGFLHLNTEALYYTNMTCKKGGTSVMGDCTFEQGACKHTSHNFANVFCRKKDLQSSKFLSALLEGDWVHLVDLPSLYTRETNFVTSCLLYCKPETSEKGVYSNRKEFAPHGEQILSF